MLIKRFCTYIAAASFITSFQLFANLIVHGAGEDFNGNNFLEFGQVPVGAQEEKVLTICGGNINEYESDNLQFNVTESPEAEIPGCQSLTIRFIASASDCNALLTQGSLSLAHDGEETVILLRGMELSEEVWNKQQNWRYSGAYRHKYSPFIVSATRDNLIMLGGNIENNEGVPTRAKSLMILKTDGHRFLQHIHDFDSKEYFNLVIPALKEDPGIIPVNHITARDGLFAGVQPNGFVLVYNASNYIPASTNNELAPNLWRSRGFGGSPRLCSGPCLFSDAAHYNEGYPDACAVNSIPPDYFCAKDYPSKGEGVAIISSGKCLVVTNTFYHEIDTLSFNFADRSRLNRSYHYKLGDIDLAEKSPELIVADNDNHIIVINREHSSAITCTVNERSGVPGTSEESICELNECHEFCDPVLATADSAGYLPGHGLVIASTGEQRVYLITSDGTTLGRYPEDPTTMQACGLTKVVSHPHKNLVALLYKQPATVVILSWNGEEFIVQARFDQTSVPDMDNPVDAVFNHHDGQDTLLVAMAGSREIITFQALPESAENTGSLSALPDGLTLVNSSVNASADQSTCYLAKPDFVQSDCVYNDSPGSVPCGASSPPKDNSALIAGLVTGSVIILVAGTAVISAGVIYWCVRPIVQLKFQY